MCLMHLPCVIPDLSLHVNRGRPPINLPARSRRHYAACAGGRAEGAVGGGDVHGDLCAADTAGERAHAAEGAAVDRVR